MNFKKLSVLIFTLGCAQLGHAATETMSQRSEARFLEIAGTHAVPIAPHFYRVEKNGAVHHYAFGYPAIQQLNAIVIDNLALSDPSAAERFSNDLAAVARNAEKDSDAMTIALCNANVTADVAAWTSPGFSNHSVSAAANVTHNQRSKLGYWGVTFASAIACLPTNTGESCSYPYGETVSDGDSATLTPSAPHVGASATATTGWPSFSFSRLQGYASAGCGQWEGVAAHVCQGDGYFNTCP